MFRVIVSASRRMTDIHSLEGWCDYYLQNQRNVQILHMTESGADKFIEVYAKRRGYERREFLVDRRRKAGYDQKARLRTHMEMILHADAVIAFDWGGDEIAHLIKVASEAELLVKVVCPQ